MNTPLSQKRWATLEVDPSPGGVVGGDDDDAVGGIHVGDVGVSEAEVLELMQRWSDLRDRETFHLLALERAVHEVIRPRPCRRSD